LSLFLFWVFLKNPSYQEAKKIFVSSFSRALRNCFLLPAKKYSVELWKWETMADEDVCEDCLKRASWPPMDIADWMKYGIPGTPEAETHCGEECRCQLIRCDSKKTLKKIF
jgi:hypothetical protein